jgi:hypothetical protein
MPYAMLHVRCSRTDNTDRYTDEAKTLSYYKTNYKEEKAKSQPKETLQAEFERKALEKLGGSIAFVMKDEKFVWKPKSK